MNKDVMRRTSLVRLETVGAKRFAGNVARYRGPWPLIGANDSPERYKWPRPMRLAVALGFGASVWVAILSRLYM